MNKTIDSIIYISIIPGRHVIEPDHMVVLHPRVILPPGHVSSILQVHITLVAHQHHGHRDLVTQLHGADIV